MINNISVILEHCRLGSHLAPKKGGARRIKAEHGKRIAPYFFAGHNCYKYRMKRNLAQFNVWNVNKSVIELTEAGGSAEQN